MFVCTSCGAHEPRWAGRCSRCGSWGALEPGAESVRSAAKPRALCDVDTAAIARRKTGSVEFDRVLGGGMVPGSTALIGGEPGIGKSTLLLAMSALAGARTLYVTGEESPAQVALRARRLGLDGRSLFLLDTTDTGEIAAVLERERHPICVVDSVQTLSTKGATGAPGGPSQVRAAAGLLVPVARATNTSLFLVGQVTKEGGLAGPRFLEHVVDAVLLFEGDRQLAVRALRAVKNRYGPTDEIGLFEMGDNGLREVRNASDLLLACRGCAGPGSVLAAVVEGRRALCVEVQALLVGDNKVMPRRRARGLELRRAELLVGVVESLFAPEVAKRDAFINVAGGLTITDSGLDLAAAAAVLGAHEGSAVDPGAIVMGEVGLRGEVRAVPRLAARLKEARAMGFQRAFVPSGSEKLDGLECIEVKRLNEVLLIRR